MNDLIYNRRSIRKYLDKQVSKELIEQIIDAGRVSPSAKNRQPWRYIVLGGESKLEFLEHMWKGILREENEYAKNYRCLHCFTKGALYLKWSLSD